MVHHPSSRAELTPATSALRRARPERGPARRQRAPWERGGAPGGSGARGEEGTGASTARAGGPSSDLPPSRAVQRPAAQKLFGPRRLK